MATARLSRRQKRMRSWVVADEKRPGGLWARAHPARVAALPHAKGHRSHRLRRWEAQGWLVLVRTPGGHTESLYLTAEGRQKASVCAGSYAEGVIEYKLVPAQFSLST